MRQNPDTTASRIVRTSGRTGRPSLFAALAGALALAACISDGPNRTGGEYLDEHDIRFNQQLQKVVLPSFPVDSSWTTDNEPDRLGDSLLLVGRWNGFTAQSRLAYDISDSSYLDSIGEDHTLRLSLAFLRPGRSATQLEGTVAGADTVRLVVESWVVLDTGLASARRADTLRAWTRRFIVRQDTTTLFNHAYRVADTVVLKVDSLYKKDSLVTFPVQNLRHAMRRRTDLRQLVLLQISLVEDSARAPAMLRFAGALRVGSSLTAYAPALLFGKSGRSALVADRTQRLFPMTETSRGRLAVNAKVRFHGSDSTLLVGRNRGLHLRIGRERFLDSLRAYLPGGLLRDPGEEFDLSYFVPFASIGLPIDTPTVSEGGFPLGFFLRSDLDSLLPTPDPTADPRVELALGDTVELFQYTPRSETKRQIVSAAYLPVAQDSGLRQIVFLNSRDTALRDTTFLVPGRKEELIPAVGTSTRFTLTPRADGVSLDYHLDTRAHTDDQIFRDPVTGDNLDQINRRVPRWLHPTDETLTLRATRGFQRLVNRGFIGNDLQSDLFIAPFAQPAADSVANALVPYPVLGEVKPRIQGDSLRVSITLYLYPLKDR